MDNFAPFYVGQEIVAVNAHPVSRFINGNDYICAAIEYKINPANGLGPFWYIGIVGHEKGAAWFAPRIFAPKQSVEWISFSEVEITQSVN